MFTVQSELTTIQLEVMRTLGVDVIRKLVALFALCAMPWNSNAGSVGDIVSFECNGLIVIDGKGEPFSGATLRVDLKSTQLLHYSSWHIQTPIQGMREEGVMYFQFMRDGRPQASLTFNGISKSLTEFDSEGKVTLSLKCERVDALF